MNNWQNNTNFQLSLAMILAVYAFLFTAGPNGISRLLFFNFSPQIVVHDESTRYDLRFTKVNGLEVDPPVYFSDAEEWVPDQTIYDGQHLINRLGIAAHRQDLVAVQQLHQEFIRAHAVQLQSAEYQLILVVKNPVEKYRIESEFSEELIETFSFDRANMFAGAN